MNSTIDYYNKNAEEFHGRTIDLDVSKNCLKFISYLPEQAHILDAGCGTGRDALFFIDHNYHVSAFDAAQEMVKLASLTTGIDVKQQMFQDFSGYKCYDGIWANASLLHIPHDEIRGILTHLHQALKHNGILYASFKYGVGSVTELGRAFWFMDEQSLRNYFKDLFKIIDLWIDLDARIDKPQWLNIIARKII